MAWIALWLTAAVVAWAVVEVVGNRRHNGKHEAARAEREAALGEEIAALRQRVEVLERIVTDRGYDLREEIERLRTGS
jgi:hypothetical protein